METQTQFRRVFAAPTWSSNSNYDGYQ